MIVVKLMGGLGNQMFQYAAGRSLALRRGAQLKLDLSWFADHRKRGSVREFGLEPFRIAATVASAWELPEATAKPGLLARLLRSAPPQGQALRVVGERHFHYDPDMLASEDGAYLCGYWQSERYFLDVADTIRAELVLKEEPAGTTLELAGLMAATASVSLHVRRGDYVSNPSINAVHGTCSLSYYQRAIEHLAGQVPGVRFFIFSDDIAWCRENISSRYPVTFVNHNGPDQAHEDLFLMSRCRHHIIANSSLSWWGAWLGTSAGKIVVAPKDWFSDPRLSSADLVPQAWTKL